jgi:hypothetical protein
MKRYTLFSAIPIGAITVFLHIGKRYTPFLAFHQFFRILPIIWAQGAATHFVAKSKMAALENKNKNVQHPTLEQYRYLSTDTISTHLSFRWTIPKRGYNRISNNRPKYVSELHLRSHI